MKRDRSIKRTACILIVCVSLAFGTALSTGCATNAQTGALAGAGTGALIGGLANMHGSWGATALLGAGIGAGAGYLIGNEMDKKDAARRKAAEPGELRPLAGTTWKVVRIEPEPRDSYKSIVSSFKHDGTVVTTKTDVDGKKWKTTEKYRIVGSTLILSHPDYVENTGFKMEGDKLTIDYGNGTTILNRVR